MKTARAKSKLFFCFLAALVFTVSFSSAASQAFAQQTSEEKPEYFMGILILESDQQAILDSINKVKELQLGNMVILHPLDQAWNLELIEQAIKEADSLGLYTIFECFNFSDHEIRITPQQFSTWQTKYPHLLGILVQEITGKQVDMNLWQNNSTGTVDTRLEAEQLIIENITSSMRLEEYKESGATILLQENVVSYASANTSFCDVLITKVFNAPNTELMIGLTRGMTSSYDIPAWGLWVDTWREWEKPPAFTANDVERALYEGWFYGAKYFFFEQGCFFGTLDRDWDNKYIILGEDGKLTEYGQVIQRFYAFLQNQNSLEYEQPSYSSSIAVMIGQSGWSSRGKDWGLWEQSDRQADFDYTLLNLFFPGIGDNWQIGAALTGKEFTGLPFGMVDVISIYAPESVLKQYDVIIALGWSQMSDAIADNIEEYVTDGGIFLSMLTFTHNNETVDDLEDPYAWTEGFSSLFGVQVNGDFDSEWGVTADAFLHNVTFTQDTFWYPWNGKTYSYADSNETGSWFWKYRYILSDNENTRVIAWVDGMQVNDNAFIIENRKGDGYTYIVNTRSSNSLPDGVLTDVLTDFIYTLCAYYARPMTYISYPENEYWLSQGQADRIVYLLHDNSTDTQTISYYVRALDANLDVNKEYLVFDYLNNEFYGTSLGTQIQLNVTLQTNEAKLFLLLEEDGTPKVIGSDSILSATPVFADQQMTITLRGVAEASNVTTIYCADLESPQYILGAPFNLAQDYSENNILRITSDSNITIGWDDTTNVSVAASTVSLTNVSWNSTLGTLSICANTTAGQEASVQVQTGGTTPYYVTINGEETSWSYDASTGLISSSFWFTSDTAELVFGFKPIIVNQAVVSDERTDVGSAQTVGFHLAWMNNSSDVKGATVEINGIEYVTNSTGWVSFDVSYDVVGKVSWNVTGVEYDDLTVYAKAVNDPSIVWDRVKVTDSIVVDELVQAGSQKTVWLTAEYEYDSVIFDDSKGTVFLNGEEMTWSSQNLRWEQTVTSNALGPQTYQATSVDDQSFGLTTVQNQDTSIDITYDKTEITKTEMETNDLGVTNARAYVAYSYTKSPVVNATVTINGNSCNEIEKGTYTCTINDWSPIQSILVEAESANFEQATKEVTSIQVANTTLYSIIGAAITIVATFFVLKRRWNKQKREA
ncbi:MAG: hypothetical protein NWF06_06730 [Candidatus Bathyarchaeota archaeon]|nr:hypothetical protein [Candidatus Bathyarchaeum sp.]